MINETSNSDRQRIVDSYIEGKPVKTITEVLGLNRTTVYGIIRTYTTENRIEKKPRGGRRNQKLTLEHKDRIRAFVDEDCSLSLRELVDKCRDELRVIVSQKTIDRCIRAFHYSLKRTHSLPERRNDEATIRIRTQYAEMFMQLIAETDESKFIFIDEVGFSMSMRCRRGRSLRGTRAVHVVNGLRTRNMSACCVMSRGGILKHSVQPRAFNTESFIQFVEELMTLLDETHVVGAVLIMDNVPFHRNIRVRQLIEDRGHRLLLLPPYSPFLNPIENGFSKWKGIVREGRARSEEVLLGLIEDGHRAITADDCAGYYRHVFRFLPRCIRGEPIIEE